MAYFFQNQKTIFLNFNQIQNHQNTPLVQKGLKWERTGKVTFYRGYVHVCMYVCVCAASRPSSGLPLVYGSIQPATGGRSPWPTIQLNAVNNTDTLCCQHTHTHTSSLPLSTYKGHTHTQTFLKKNMYSVPNTYIVQIHGN